MRKSSLTVSSQFQSTLPRGERRLTYKQPMNHQNISIHAPARGATEGPEVFERFKAISIHAPARGATTSTNDKRGADHDFNPRSRAGSDHRYRLSLAGRQHFNPRSRAGSDLPASVLWIAGSSFQSTLPRGERLPLPPAGLAPGDISIHAPARGATGAPRRSPLPDVNFNPRSRAGSDISNVETDFDNGISIHAPARGATGAAEIRIAGLENFNPRSRAGSDGCPTTTGRHARTFQSTLPRGERQGPQ